MPSRREFIQRVLSASILAASPRCLHLVLAGDRDAGLHRPVTVIFDRAFVEASTFGTEAARRGASALAFERDPGGVWMNQIEPQWKSGRSALAGLTTLPSLFCLELLGRDYGMAMTYCAEHQAIAGNFAHRILIGRNQMSQWEPHLTAAHRRWGGVAAAMP